MRRPNRKNNKRKSSLLEDAGIDLSEFSAAKKRRVSDHELEDSFCEDASLELGPLASTKVHDVSDTSEEEEALPTGLGKTQTKNRFNEEI